MRLDKPIYACDWCRETIPDPNEIKRSWHKPQDVNAVIILLGHSFGGWGMRQTSLEERWEEVCLKCFSQYEILAHQLKELTKGSRVR